MARGLGGVLPASLRKYLAGISYPASKGDPIWTARRNSAPNEVMEVIERLPGENFEAQRRFREPVATSLDNARAGRRSSCVTA